MPRSLHDALKESGINFVAYLPDDLTHRVVITMGMLVVAFFAANTVGWRPCDFPRSGSTL